MSLGAFGAFMLVLVLVFIAGNLWFHFVEALLARIRQLFTHREPPAWYPLPGEDRGEE